MHLHVAAMPFPTVQGTQAAVRAMIDAEHEAGLAPELLTYAHGGPGDELRWPIHRVADLSGDRSLRSGPSWRKLVADAQLVLATRRLVAARRPRRILAHHVEAAAAALAARAHPLAFVAHTALGPELPTYLPARAASIAARAGEALDVALARRADVVLAVSPRLAERLTQRSGRPVQYAPVPWRCPPPIDAAERAAARAALRLDAVTPVLLYAGNLDAYQGLEGLLQAIALLGERRPDARLLLATASDPGPFIDALRAAGLADRLVLATLADENDRRRVHAAADAAVIPRGAEGGLPVKLLDAMARGVPVVAVRRATAALSLDGAALVAADDDPEALAAAALIALEARETRGQLGQRGVEYVQRAHAPSAYLAALSAALDGPRSGST